MSKTLRTVPVKQVRYYWMCPKCQGGEMIYTGDGNEYFGWTFHRCNQCKFEEADKECRQYPYVDYVDDCSRSVMDSTRVSETLRAGSIPAGNTDAVS